MTGSVDCTASTNISYPGGWPNIRHEAGTPITGAIGEATLGVACLASLGPQRGRALVETPAAWDCQLWIWRGRS